MKTFSRMVFLTAMLLMAACKSDSNQQINNKMGIISQQTTDRVIASLADQHGEDLLQHISRGVSQAAAFWMETDGTQQDFERFCQDHFRGDPAGRHRLFETLSFNYEKIWGHFNQMGLELNKALHLDVGPIDAVDVMFGSYSPAAHLTSDFFDNKIAFLTMLNFPFYSLQEKAAHAATWSRLDWAYARMGDVYTARVPAVINQEAARIATESDNYISEYNIMMGRLIDDEGRSLFPETMRLITHWGLRDEIKSNYALEEEGLQKQQMIYKVMERIISQEIPAAVINNPEYTWNPYTNKLYLGTEEVVSDPEPDTRYQHLLNNFKAMKAADPYSPSYPTAIERAFDQGLELSIDEVEALFVNLVSHPVLQDVGGLIMKRLGRDLEPFDIWYDGFKARSNISEEQLNKMVHSRYPDRESFENDLPVILVQLGWDRQRADEIASKIVVEASRGAGHAWGASMKSQNSHLRTRIGQDGMDYKGYNIAIHEFGHNVEQTISLHDVDHYLMSGVPNTAFTEALAFMFQSRDLKLLGMPGNDLQAEYLKALDKIWGSYEIMGVSLVDMKVWRWMYDNPSASAEELKNQVISIAKQTWNDYFAPVFGVRDATVLAVYSHMISYPLYLSAYPLGRLIEFQLEGPINGEGLAAEADRVFALGRLIPQEWMKQAVGDPVSAGPMIEAASEAVMRLGNDDPRPGNGNL